MGTLKFYVYLCIFSFKVFGAKDDSDSSKTAPVNEDIYYDTGMTQDETGKQLPLSDESESKSISEQPNDNPGKQPQTAGDIVNNFKKPFININQDRTGWPEEKLISKLLGKSFAETEGGNSYQSSVRSFGLTFFNIKQSFHRLSFDDNF